VRLRELLPTRYRSIVAFEPADDRVDRYSELADAIWTFLLLRAAKREAERAGIE
jgi:hypothetical protein